jgi:uncharacterized protein (TIGR02001 family)
MAAGSARAADEQAAAEDAAAAFDVAFGVAVITDYIADGITQTDHKPAVQAYIEPSYGIFYAGIWASNVSFSGDTGLEGRVYAGIRPELGSLSFDFGYLHGFYTNGVADPWDELDASVEFAAGNATLGTGVAYIITSGDVTPEVTAAYDLGNGFEVSGRLAYVIYSDPTLIDYATWDAGASWTWNDKIKFDVRYYDSAMTPADCAVNSGVSTACGATFVASISVDTSLSALKGGDQ